ncbi:unnamed protein product [Brassica oleracea var. botrytis]
MVETTPITRDFMLSHCTTARASSLFPVSTPSWYFRCIGVDP